MQGFLDVFLRKEVKLKISSEKYKKYEENPTNFQNASLGSSRDFLNH